MTPCTTMQMMLTFTLIQADLSQNGDAFKSQKETATLKPTNRHLD
jgi:hypothetical protein